MAREPWLDDGPATDPTLIGRIGHTALRSIAVLPADWSRERLIELTRRQAIANQLQTCLCLGPTDGIYLSPDGSADASDSDQVRAR